MGNQSDLVQTITSSALVPTPDGYYLDIWVDLKEPGDGQKLIRFKFEDVSQMTDHSKEARRIALLATHFEELSIGAEDVQQDDLVPSLGGGTVYSIDSELRYDDEDTQTDGVKKRWMLFTFAGTVSVLSMPAEDRITILRKIQ